EPPGPERSDHERPERPERPERDRGTIMTIDEMEFVASERPAPVPLRPETTERARRALLDHAALAADADLAPVVALSATPASGRRRGRRVLRLVAVAAALVVIGLVGLELGGGNDRLGTKPAAAEPLVRLAHDVQTSPPPTGDATLVLRTQRYPDRTSIAG